MLQRRAAACLDEASAQPAGTTGPAHVAMAREQTEKMDEIMAQLPEEQRETIVLHLQSKLRFREIARLQGISINTAMSRYRYGLDRLRSSLNGELKQ